MDKFFSEKAWKDYLGWYEEDKRILKKINEIIRDIDRNGNDGIGKPEALMHQLSGYWSRKISDKDRLIYKINEGSIYIMGCKGHYED